MAYSVSSTDANCYPGTTVLVNKLGLQKQEALDEAERIAVTLRSVELERAETSAPFTFEYYCKLHEHLFSDIYEWAGTLRTIDLAKKGTTFYPAESLTELGNALFSRLQENNEYRNLPKDEYARGIAEFYHDLNMLHPFREGNGRTQRLFFTLLVRRAGYQIDFSQCDKDVLMMATIYAAQGILDYLIDFWKTALH